MERIALQNNVSDGHLLRLAQKGEESAFLTLYHRHQGPVFRFALHMSGRQDLAEEVTQEVFMALLSASSLYTAERGPLQAYLLGIARNKVRRQLSERRLFTSDFPLIHPQAGSLPVEQESQLMELRAAILRLPPNYREVVVLCDLEQMDYEQAARQLGCALGTVRSRLHRARAILTDRLRPRLLEHGTRRVKGCPA